MEDAIVELSPLAFGWFALWAAEKRPPSPIVAWGKIRYSDNEGPPWYLWHPLVVSRENTLSPVLEGSAAIVHASQIAPAPAANP